MAIPQEEKNATLVFVPFPVVSHQTAAVRMAKVLVARDRRLSATVILMKLPIDTKTESYSNTSNSPGGDGNSRINFVELVAKDYDPDWFKTYYSFVTHFIRSQTGPVRAAVVKLSEGPARPRLAGFVVDMFCTPMIDVADDLGLPSYVFYPCGAASLGLFLHLQGLADRENRDLPAEFPRDSDSAVSIPTYADPVPAKVWPYLIYEEEGVFMRFARRFRETKGILVNTFLEFEPRAIDALSGDRSIPPVYPVGPVIEERTDDDGVGEWLDGQPDSSVVFLCFGSRGCFEKDQIWEIARALESSGARFLWSLRKPALKEKLGFPREYENPGDILPDGFLERTVGIGKVIGWAPQLAILSHVAVGGFVSHCGWNSTLESVWCGVPMATWPLAAEQQANAFQLVKEFGMAVKIKMDYRRISDVIVPAEKIEQAVRELMDPMNECRAKVKALSEKSRVVMKDGGSSFDYLGSFIDKVLDHVS